ncbi:septal ring lytic transglycosylase RlpA family protein [Siccirubricoccus deserti]|uniref:Endolytic peptidoglycan transglycosylase RlpA n=1 Tax=Siccirubricoccus deserti TaxID=2013562 RepID=A0A9X0UG68_9PROT|nr:septal ring lytic transglycosylase RlpA family protein [Siccirubricoccus deserti]MBC4018701.1 septal ring lytic transglycosylase RlpA family protein [Siccirubricoccus deserti]
MPNVTSRSGYWLAAFLVGVGVACGTRAEPRAQQGEASFYHPERFSGRPMANGDRFEPNSNAAAHRTLPLGTVADVENLQTGESRRVVIEDRGPYANGRIIDVSPRTADELGMRESGVAPVEVRPVGRLPERARDGRSGTE